MASQLGTGYEDMLNVRGVAKFDKYLGLPTVIGRDKSQVFKIVVERVLSRIKAWKEKALTKAGREILIKTVLQAIPNFAMSCFLFPISTCKEIERAIARFYWGSTEQERKHHWVSWDRATRSKKMGGLGFREIFFFNLSMVTKQLWRISSNPTSMVTRILKAKYFPNVSINDAQGGTRPSYIWRSLMRARELVQQGSAWRIGDGNSVKACTDNWIGMTNPKPPNDHALILDPNTPVSDFILVDTTSWNVELVEAFFSADDAQAILSIPLSPRLPRDKLYWKMSKSGKFTVRTAYHLAVDLFSSLGKDLAKPSTNSKDWSKMWNINTLPKIRHFLWRACNEALPTRHNLVRRRMANDAYCAICGEENESTDHILLRCPTTREIWLKSPVRIHNILQGQLCFRPTCWSILVVLPDEGKQLFSFIAWNIWLARNKFYFDNTPIIPNEVLRRAVSNFHELQKLRNTVATPQSQPVARNISWQAPLAGEKKLNFDAAVYTDGSIGLGFIVRDHFGAALIAGVKRMKAQGTSTLFEALALHFGLVETCAAGILVMEAEGDNLNLISLLSDVSNDEAYCGQVVDDIKHLARAVSCSSFKFVPREANNVAHAIAHLSLDVGDTSVWIGEVPNNINVLSLRDVGRQPNTLS